MTFKRFGGGLLCALALLLSSPAHAGTVILGSGGAGSTDLILSVTGSWSLNGGSLTPIITATNPLETFAIAGGYQNVSRYTTSGGITFSGSGALTVQVLQNLNSPANLSSGWIDAAALNSLHQLFGSNPAVGTNITFTPPSNLLNLGFYSISSSAVLKSTTAGNFLALSTDTSGAVPEFGTAILLGSGIMLIGWIRKRPWGSLCPN